MFVNVFFYGKSGFSCFSGEASTLAASSCFFFMDACRKSVFSKYYRYIGWV